MNHRQPHIFKASSSDANPALAKRRASRDGIPEYVVQLPERGGRSVLAGDVIINVSHCINFNGDGGMTLFTLGAAWTFCGPRRALSANRKTKRIK